MQFAFLTFIPTKTHFWVIKLLLLLFLFVRKVSLYKIMSYFGNYKDIAFPSMKGHKTYVT